MKIVTFDRCFYAKHGVQCALNAEMCSDNCYTRVISILIISNKFYDFKEAMQSLEIVRKCKTNHAATFDLFE